ncbi:MAG: hypothetical protein U9Q06_01420 [Nanoarchaeota archaeon]|nr:hypothetical protein [Nanoarchaeota archaeon]
MNFESDNVILEINGREFSSGLGISYEAGYDKYRDNETGRFLSEAEAIQRAEELE